MEIKYFSPTELKDYENNAKLHPDSQIRLIIRNIESAGFYNPILISPDKTIIAGHGRRKAAIQAGLKEVPCIVLDVDTTTANKLRLMDNKSAESGYDLEKLVEELQTFSTSEIDDTGYSISDLDRMLDDLGKISVIPSQGTGPGYFDDEPDESESDGDSKEYQGSVNEDFDSEHEDDVPEETEVETRVKTGDIWQIGNHFILCGDCTVERNVRELLGSVKVDMVFTDPPYGINTSIANDNLSEKELVDFNLKWSEIAFDILKDNSVLVCFHSTRLFWTALDTLRQKGFRFLRYLTLYKPNDCTFPWHRWILKSESILLFEKGKGSFEKVEPYYHDTLTHVHGKEQQEDRGGHPCCKPTSFIADFIKSFSGKIVFDFFLGSGTTLIACEKTNRVCYGTELSEKYCDVIVTRWEKLTGKTAKLLRNINS